MDMIIRHIFVMVKRRNYVCSVLQLELHDEYFQQLFPIVLLEALRQRDDQLPRLDACTFGSTFEEIFPILLREIIPELRLYRSIDAVEMLLPLGIADIIDPALYVGQLRMLDKRMSADVSLLSAPMMELSGTISLANCTGSVYARFRAFFSPAQPRNTQSITAGCAMGVFRSQSPRALLH